MEIKLKIYGESACFVSGGGRQWCDQLEAALSARPPNDFLESVRGHDNLLLIFKSPFGLDGIKRWLARLPALKSIPIGAGREIELAVRYNGPDLKQVAAWAGLSQSAVIDLHTTVEYRVRLIGFMPGFPYLEGLDPRLHFERRASPRNYIPAGSVAIGGAHAGIYSVGSPGGWHLLGQTQQPLVMLQHAQAARIDPAKIFALNPGDRVRFVPVD